MSPDNDHHQLNHREDEVPEPGLVPVSPHAMERRGPGRPRKTPESMAKKVMEAQREEGRKRQRIATQQANRVKRAEVFQRAYARWLTTLDPNEAQRMLRESSVIAHTQSAKKSLFLELYKEMWPDKVACLQACGLTLSWVKEQIQRDPEFGAEILAIELRRLDTLKAYSYEQAFHPQNVNERLFWLKTIGRDEFGEDPLVNITNNIVQTDDFSRLETLIKRRDQLLKLKEEAIARAAIPATPTQSTGPGTGDSITQQ